MGFSFGGQIAIRAAAENNTIVHQIIVDRVPILEICKLEMQLSHIFNELPL